MTKGQKVYLFFKRIIDIFGSILGIIFCLALLWWWVLIINIFATKGHPVFVQQRLGKKKKVFGLIKFRSMKMSAKEIAPSDMTPEVQASMDTKFGKFLRKTSIDETLQLLNIFVGQMSFIGPRPGAAHNEEELVRLRESYTPNAFDVKPGLSGYAQVMMNREHDPEEKAKYDHEYVAKLSFGLDAKIFFKTILKLFGSGKGR
ncbi:MAG: sugar transferase [Bacilli bacterium]|nr:sugar transferase [Bacilli bacterium]